MWENEKNSKLEIKKWVYKACFAENILVILKVGYMASTYLKVCLVPNSREFKISSFNWNNELKVYVKSKPKNFEANEELKREFEKIFQTEVEIIKGKTNKHKLIKINKPEKEVLSQINHL